MCSARRWPFVTISQSNLVAWWPDDALAGRYRAAIASALRCYFVSKANRCLAEKQIGCEIPNSEVVWNPFNVDIHASLPWPPMGRNGELRFACVARLDPKSKGQDILFEVLARPSWSLRCYRLHLYGNGPRREGLERLAHRLGLADRVVFEGQVDPQETLVAKSCSRHAIPLRGPIVSNRRSDALWETGCR